MNELTFGYLLPTFEATAANSGRLAGLIDVAVKAEQFGFDTLWLPDSPFQYGLVDPLLTIATIAARTERIKLSPGVLLAGLRQPALLAQQLSSLDALTGGRLIAGFGLGFRSPASEQQFEASGMPYASRVRRLEEAVELMRALWAAAGEPVNYSGKQVNVRELVLSPQPVTPGGPPIWLAGAGASAEARVGRLADGWLPYLQPEAYVEGWARVREAAELAGRPTLPTASLYLTVSLDSSVEVAQQRLATRVQGWYGRPFELIASFQAMFAGTPEGLIEYLQPYVAAGLQHVVLRVADEPESGLHAAAAVVAETTGQISRR